MCNWRKWIWPGILATVLLTALALQMKSGIIEADLQSKALADLSEKHKWASVELDGRDLTLSGQSPSEDAITEALQLADDAYDVRIAQSDATLLPLADPFTLSAVKADNKVVLTGAVPNDDVRATVLEAAKNSYQGAEIIDNLELSRGAPDGFGDLAGFGIGQLSGLNSGTASLTGSSLSVTGEAPSVDIYNTVTAALNGALPGNGTLGTSDITGPTADPFTLTAVKSDSGVVLEGFVPSNEARDQVIAAATNAAGGQAVTDNLQLSLGAPAGFADLAGFAIGQLTDLTSGNASLSGLGLSLTGTAPTVGIYNSVNAALKGVLPANGTLTLADVSSPIADPYTFTAVKSAEGIVLDGFVPSNEVRSEMVAAAQAASAGGAVTDNLRLALGNHDGFSALSGFGVAQLNQFTSGEVSLSGTGLTVSGIAPSVEAYDAANAAFNAALPGDGVLASADINGPTADPFTLSAVKSDQGIVLEGFVSSNDARNQVVKAAEAAANGKPVTDNLTLSLGAPADFSNLVDFGIAQLTELTTGNVSLSGTDLSVAGSAPTVGIYNTVTAALSGALPANGKLASADITSPVADPYQLKAVKTGNELVLSGFLPSEQSRSQLVAAAEAANPGVTVKDELRLALGNPDGFEALAGFGVTQLGSFSNGEASLNGLNLSVKGEAKSIADFDTVTANLANNLPSGSTLAMQDITKPDVKPYTFSAIEKENGVSLEGFVPDEATRAALVEAAGKTTSGTVTDNLQIGAGAPAGFAELAGFGVARLSDFSTGTVSISDLDLTIRGTALTPENYDSAVSASNGEIPSNGRVVLAEITRSTVTPYIFSAVKSANTVTLSGYVNSEADQSSIVEFAGQTNPGATIIDQLVIANGVPDGVDWNEANRLALKEVGSLNDGSASINDDQYTIEGVAKSPKDYDSVKAEANAPLAAGLKLAKENVRLPAAGSYRWTLTNMEEGDAVLDGFMPNAENIADTASQVMAILGGKTVSNNLTRASGEPENLSAAIDVGVKAVSRLKNGIADINDGVLMVSGEAASESEAAEIRTDIEKVVPSGFTGKHNITVKKVVAPKPEPVVVAKPEPVAAPKPEPVDCQLLLVESVNNETILFETNKSIIKPESFELLGRIVSAAEKCPTATIEVGGHTDSVGSDTSNQALSEARANAVRAFMVGKGIFVGRLNAVGYGETKPVADNSTDEGKAVNRRIEFNVVR